MPLHKVTNMVSKNLPLDRRKERASQRRHQRRTQVCAAAKKVFSRKGYHASSIEDILQEAGIARGTFYLYFPSKRAIFEELLEQMFAQITGAVRRIQTNSGSESVVEQMLGNVDRIINVIESNRELTIILLREAVGLDIDFDQKLAAFYYRLSDMIEGALRLGQEMQIIRPCDVRLVSYCVLGSIKEVILRILTDCDQSKLQLDSIAQEVLNYNLRGLFLAPHLGLNYYSSGHMK